MTIDVNEALRYLVAGQTDEYLREQVEAVAGELQSAITPRCTWRLFDLSHSAEEVLRDSPVQLPGETAKKMLGQCHHAALLCVTLGAEFDAMLRQTQARDMVRAVLLDACGSAYVEAAANAAEADMAKRTQGWYRTDRFSPGYGDLPLTVQPAICDALDVGRRLGVTLTDSLLLNPQKTVTAIVGFADRPQAARVRGCAYCSLGKTCQHRKGGDSCGL